MSDHAYALSVVKPDVKRAQRSFPTDQNGPTLQTRNQAVIGKNCECLNTAARIETVRN